MPPCKAGSPRWCLWAFFSPVGTIKRLPFAVCTFILYLLMQPYVSAAIQILAVHILPPPDGGRPSPEYARALAMSASAIPLLLPLCFMRLCLEMKRLRSIGVSPLIALPFAALFLFSPLIPPSLGEMSTLSAVAYLGILAVVPAKEDRMSPLERKSLTWRAIATGNGTPRRLSGAEILSWRIVRQGPAKE